MVDKEVVHFLTSKKFSDEGNKFTRRYRISRFDIKIQIEFPESFPYELPDIIVSNSSELPLMPHVDAYGIDQYVDTHRKDRCGKICLFHADSIVTDYRRPVDIVNDLLEKALAILKDGLTNDSTEELMLEFLSYWNGNTGLISLIKVDESPRQILSGKVEWRTDSSKEIYVVADNKTELLSFLERFNSIPKNKIVKAIYIPLYRAVHLLRDEKKLTVRGALTVKDISSTIQDREFSSLESENLYNKFIKENKLPFNLLLSAPSEDSRVLFGFHIRRAKDRRRACKGFRPDKIPAFQEIKSMNKDLLHKFTPERYDKDYLLKRSGGNTNLNNKSILMLGAGSVGGYLAEFLASIGIENIVIIDNDKLSNENLYRHCLGIQYIEKNKARALKDYLESKYKDLNITFYDNFDIGKGISKILEVLHKSNINMVISLTGDENLNRKVNKVFPADIPLLFGWIELLGIGLHIVSANIANTKGCLECLYISDEGNFSANGAMFCVPSQNVRKVYAGCRGSYLPHSGLDAIKLALDIAYTVVEIFNGDIKENFLKSTLGKKKTLSDASFCLTKRAELFKDYESKIETNFASTFCEKCNR